MYGTITRFPTQAILPSFIGPSSPTISFVEKVLSAPPPTGGAQCGFSSLLKTVANN